MSLLKSFYSWVDKPAQSSERDHLSSRILFTSLRTVYLTDFKWTNRWGWNKRKTWELSGGQFSAAEVENKRYLSWDLVRGWLIFSSYPAWAVVEMCIPSCSSSHLLRIPFSSNLWHETDWTEHSFSVHSSAPRFAVFFLPHQGLVMAINAKERWAQTWRFLCFISLQEKRLKVRNCDRMIFPECNFSSW